MKHIYKFYASCDEWDRNDIDNLERMIEEAMAITRRTFIKHVDRSDMRSIAAGLGYSRNDKTDLTLDKDYHVSYYRSKLHNKRVYFLCHSSIEYVFTEGNK